MSNTFAKQIVQNNFNLNEEMEKAKVLSQLTFEQLGYPELFNKTSIEFNNRYVNIAGTAKFKSFSGVGEIKLSSKFFAISSEEEKVETIIHEVCHIADRYISHVDRDWFLKYSISNKKTKGHGNGWIELMSKVGYKNARRCHSVNTDLLKSYYKYNCSCGKTFVVTAQMGGRIKNMNAFRICSTCKAMIKPNGLIKINGIEKDLIVKGK